ncbi:MAG: hypothetical protein OEN50_10525 [Deltaproteobacteria bacterium]|nr:hypothetical protein [Deltaproteobacteria bacterium]
MEILPGWYANREAGEFRDGAPKVIILEDGTLVVPQEGQVPEGLISNIACGLRYEKRRPFDPLPGDNYESLRNTGSPKPRLRDQETDGVMRKYSMPAMSDRVSGAKAGIYFSPRWRPIRSTNNLLT